MKKSTNEIRKKTKKRAPNIRAKTIYHGVNTVATICARFRKKSARAFVLFAKARPQDHNLTEDKKKQKKTWKRISKSKLKKNIFVDTVIIVPLKLVLMNDDEFVSVKRARN